VSCEHPMHDDDCPHGCEFPRVCEFCGASADEERECKSGRAMFVCYGCGEDMDRARQMDRAERERERAVDLAISEWKDEGRRR